MADNRRRLPLAPAVVALVGTMLAWALAPVFIRFLRDAYDPYSQSFIRYLGGTLGLLAVCWVRYRPEL